MSVSIFSFPTRTIFGVGALKELPASLASFGVSRPLVVTDAGLVSTEAFRAVMGILGEANQRKTWFVYSGVHPNPIESDVREAANAYQENSCDGIVAVGGGSALDVGKAARLLVKRPGFDFKKFYDEPDWGGL